MVAVGLLAKGFAISLGKRADQVLKYELLVIIDKQNLIIQDLTPIISLILTLTPSSSQ